MQDYIEEAYAAHEAKEARFDYYIPEIESLAESVDAMTQAVGLLDKAGVPRELVCNLAANTLSKWCKLRYKMSKANISLKGLDTPFPARIGPELTRDNCDFTSGLFIYVYAIGLYVSKSAEFKPLHSGWLRLRGMPRRWIIDDSTDLHRFEMDGDGNLAKYKPAWACRAQNMYVVGDLEQIANHHELAEGKYIMRACVYVLSGTNTGANTGAAAPAANQQ